MTDLPASKLAELVAKAKAALELRKQWHGPADEHQFDVFFQDPATILALAEEILRRRDAMAADVSVESKRRERTAQERAKRSLGD